MNSLDIFEVGLSAWIVQDGNYSDFEVGKEYEFALECGPEGLILNNQPSRSLKRLSEARYAFDAEVLIHEPGLTVLDVGILCYHDGAIGDSLTPGQYVSGELYLGIDPFFWFESHSQRADLPRLTYRWRVTGILLETTGWQELVDSNGGKFRSRVEHPTTFTPVNQTNAWIDDGQHAHYILQCALLGPA